MPDGSYFRFLGRLTGVKEQGRDWDCGQRENHQYRQSQLRVADSEA